MKIIITESKLEKLKQQIQSKVKERGIYDTANLLGMTTNQFINRFGFELDDEKIMKLIDFFMENKFHKIYNFKENPDICDLYGTYNTFLTVVTEAISEFCYNNFNFTSDYNIDEEDIEFENIFVKIEHYISEKYGELIKNTFIKYCGE